MCKYFCCTLKVYCMVVWMEYACTHTQVYTRAVADLSQDLYIPGLTSDTACDSLSRLETGESGETCAGAAAVRWGTWGAARALRLGLRARRLHVVLLHAPDLSASEIYAPPLQLVAPSQPSRYQFQYGFSPF